MRPSLLAAIMLASAALCAAPLQAEDKQPMNVLMLICDDLNAWLLDKEERYPGTMVVPNLKAFGQSGVVFRHAYTSAPVCNPSRASFNSGVAPWVSGIYHNAQNVSMSEPLNNALSMAGMFKQHGYGTYAYGKVTHGWDQKQHWDEKIGHKRDPAPPGGSGNPVARGEHDWGPWHLAEEELNAYQMASLTIDRLQQDHDKPFFIACGTFQTHMPWFPPQRLLDKFPLDSLVTPELNPNDLDDVPPLGAELTAGKSGWTQEVIDKGLYKEAVQAYLAATAHVDEQHGRILEALENSKYRDNTVVVFFTDHGFHLGQKGHWQKATLWEEATNVPMIWRVPGMTQPGGESTRFVSLLDVYPTLADVCGLTAPEYLDGRSMAPLLKDPNAEWISTAYSALTNRKKGDPEHGYISYRNELGRFTRYVDGQEEFYDSNKDPLEWTNQIDNPEYAEVIKKMRAALPEVAKPMPMVVRKKK